MAEQKVYAGAITLEFASTGTRQIGQYNRT